MIHRLFKDPETKPPPPLPTTIKVARLRKGGWDMRTSYNGYEFVCVRTSMGLHKWTDPVHVWSTFYQEHKPEDATYTLEEALKFLGRDDLVAETTLKD